MFLELLSSSPAAAIGGPAVTAAAAEGGRESRVLCQKAKTLLLNSFI